MDRVAIIGASMTKFDQRDAWTRELLAEAGEACLRQAGVNAKELVLDLVKLSVGNGGSTSSERANWATAGASHYL